VKIRLYLIYFILFVLSLFCSVSYSQIAFEPQRSSVYQFLTSLSQKGVIELEDQIIPIPRKEMAKLLQKAAQDSKLLTPMEQKELRFYQRDFSFELNKITTDRISDKYLNYFRKDRAGRWRLFTYSDDFFHVNISPVIGIVKGRQDGKSFQRQWNGLYFYGYLGNHIGFTFDFINAGEKGENIDHDRQFTSDPGIIPKGTGTPNQIDYNEIDVMTTFNWNWGHFSLGKQQLEWGYGSSGRIVTSNKPPSYPQIRLDIKPLDWLQFNYMHAWLNSNVIDSNEVYQTELQDKQRILYRKKYFASHTLTIRPYRGLYFSLGESIVYADRLLFAYLQPLMFFRAADHYLSGQNNNAGENSQFFLAFSSRNHLPNTHLFGTLFIDEINLRDMFSDQNRNQIGYQIGASVADLPVNNLKLTTEYSKLMPYVYRHYIPTQTYESDSYLLGHWIGHNADLIYCSINYRILRGLSATVWGQYFRKGEDGTPEEQYSQNQPSFLFGLNTNRSYAGIDIKYEITHELFLRGQMEWYKESQELHDGSFIDTTRRNMYLSIYYGM
jgi:hypothetical protein